MKRVSYADRQLGDVLLVSGTAEISKLIADAEAELEPGLDWYPSHVAIDYGNYVVEAWLDLHTNSAAALNDCAKYDFSKVEVWRPEGTPEQKGLAIHQTIISLGHELYSVPDLVGFLLEAIARKAGFKDAPNPIRLGYVCSETGLYYLRELNNVVPGVTGHAGVDLGPLYWTRTDEAIRNVSPATLRKLFLHHEVVA